jgi:hypothetical protein
MATYKDKEIMVEGHEVSIKVKGDKPAKLGNQLIEEIKSFTSNSQETFE